jgi:hypothetical protein
VRAGAKPVLVDSDAVTFNMRPDQVAEKITAHTRAIMVVHIYGLPVDMDPILALVLLIGAGSAYRPGRSRRSVQLDGFQRYGYPSETMTSRRSPLG